MDKKNISKGGEPLCYTVTVFRSMNHYILTCYCQRWQSSLASAVGNVKGNYVKGKIQSKIWNSFHDENITKCQNKKKIITKQKFLLLKKIFFLVRIFSPRGIFQGPIQGGGTLIEWSNFAFQGG